MTEPNLRIHIDYDMYKECRGKVVDMVNGEQPKDGIILLKGGEQSTQYETDTDILFRQDSHFRYMFGVREPDCYGIVDLLDKKCTLFVPNFPQSYGVWMGPIQPQQYYIDKYLVDEVKYVEEIPGHIQNRNPSVIYVNKGVNSDSGKTCEPATFEGIENYNVDEDTLYECICECRVIKTEREIELFRMLSHAGSKAHAYNIQTLQCNTYEYQIEANMHQWFYLNYGCRTFSFIPICASGRNSAILHYGHAAAPNDRIMRSGDWILMDMGCEFEGYVCDITCTCPVNGCFSEIQRIVYETVLEMKNSCQRMMRPGVEWRDVHLNANRVMLECMIRNEVFKGDIEEMMEHNLAGYFMPHGLGHFMGLDVHDVGGYPRGVQRDNRIGLRSLRVNRTLQKGMIITCEPGMYFIDSCLDMVKADPKLNSFVNWEKCDELCTVGGCRLESDCLITATGCDDLATHCPRTCKEVEEEYARWR